MIGIGLFDRFVEARVLMEIPELYRYGREGKWFGLGLFGLYMLDGVMQVSFFFVLSVWSVFVSGR